MQTPEHLDPNDDVSSSRDVSPTTRGRYFALSHFIEEETEKQNPDVSMLRSKLCSREVRGVVELDYPSWNPTSSLHHLLAG